MITNTGGNIMQEKSKYKNIIFDLGGVLIDWRPKDFLKAIFVDQPEVLKKFAQGLVGNVKDEFEKIGQSANRGTMTVNQFSQALAQSLDIDLHHAAYYVEQLPSYLVPIQQGLDILHKVKQAGFKLYILSNFPQEWFDPIEQQYDFFKLFDGGVISYRVGQVKPEPAIYHTLLSQYELVSGECLFIDDLPQNIEAGIACGIDGIVCSDHTYVAQELERLFVLSSVQTDEDKVDVIISQTD
jgi:HAD superfamily hydrolase (TIGR01509 family)